MSRLDDSKKKKLEKEFVRVSDDESGSDNEAERTSDQSDLESENSSLSEDDGKDWKKALKEEHKQIRFVFSTLGIVKVMLLNLESFVIDTCNTTLV